MSDESRDLNGAFVYITAPKLAKRPDVVNRATERCLRVAKAENLSVGETVVVFAMAMQAAAKVGKWPQMWLTALLADLRGEVTFTPPEGTI
jgi:hypothetical protein